MFSVHIDSQKKQFIIDDYQGNTYATIAWPNQSGDAYFEMPENFKAYRQAGKLVKFANAGNESLKRAERQIKQAKKVLKEFE